MKKKESQMSYADSNNLLFNFFFFFTLCENNVKPQNSNKNLLQITRLHNITVQVIYLHNI